MLKKAISYIIIFTIVLFTLLPFFNASAAIVEKGIITIATVEGNTGDTVIVPITIDENPGICGITISITYNSSALEFIEDIMGDVIYEYETKAHPTKNIIRLVTSEQGNKRNNGTMVGLKFKISEKAPAELHKIDIKYNSGDFCNWKLDRIMPKIISGGVNVGLSESNCPHKNYSDWQTATIASCLENGVEQRSCRDCGHIKLRDTEPIGHKYSDVYTIDKEATKEESGLMSRHCIRCKDYIDQISFSLEQSEEGKIENTFDTNIPTNDYINDLFKEQYPEEVQDDKESNTSNKPNNAVSEGASSKEPDINKKPSSNNSSSDSSVISQPTVSDDTNQNVLEEPLLEKDENVKITLLEKIKEVFPEFDSFFSFIKIAITILIILVII